MKSSRTLQCKICMVERKTILQKIQDDKSMVINDNSDIFSSCKCGSRFHKFSRNVTTTLRTRLTQKKVPSSRSRYKSNRKRTSSSPKSPTLCPPCSPGATSVSTEPASPQSDAGVFLYDTNVPGLPYRSPTAHPTNLERAQVRAYVDRLPILEV